MKDRLKHIVLWLSAVLVLSGLFLWNLRARERFLQHKNRAFDIRIYPGNKHFVTREDIEKILLQFKKNDSVDPLISTKKAEATLEKNPFIDRAEVYISPDGQWHTEVYQFKPVAVIDYGSYRKYLDDKGFVKPWSSQGRLGLPLIEHAYSDDDIRLVYPLVKTIYDDRGLRNKVSKISLNADGIHLKLYGFAPDVFLGDTANFRAKLDKMNLIRKALEKLNKTQLYSQINLQFNGQVICKKS